MAKRFLIAGTGPRVGKTTVGCALGFAMRARGLRVGVMKPIDTPESQDAQALALAVGSIMPMDLICPNRSSPIVSADMSHIARCFNEIAAQSDAVLVEAASPLDFADLATSLNLEVILVAGNRPDCTDATTLVLQRCESRSLTVAGCILCDCDPTPAIDDTPLREICGDRYLGRMRHREPLAKSIVEKLV